VGSALATLLDFSKAMRHHFALKLFTILEVLKSMEQEKEFSVPESVLLNDLQYQLNRLPEGMRSKFLLVLAVSERARQLVENPDQERHDENYVTRALREISEGRFRLRVTDERFLRALRGEPEETDIFPYRP